MQMRIVKTFLELDNDPVEVIKRCSLFWFFVLALANKRLLCKNNAENIPHCA